MTSSRQRFYQSYPTTELEHLKANIQRYLDTPGLATDPQFARDNITLIDQILGERATTTTTQKQGATS